VTAADRGIPRLESDRLILRPHRLDDFEASAAMRQDEAVVRYISGTPMSREDSWTRLLRYAGHWALLGFGYWVIEAKADGRFVGEAGFADYQRDIDPPLAGRPEAGWTLRSAEFGQGFATEAVLAIHAWADTRPGFGATVAIFHPDNAASIRVAEKAGYVHEGWARYKGELTLVMGRPRGRPRT